MEKMNSGRKKPNIFIIGVDALRAKNLDCYGYERSISPNIDLLAKQGVLFENAFSVGNQTDCSIAALFSGLYIEPFVDLWSYDNLFVKALEKKGYTTYEIGMHSSAAYSPMEKILNSFEERVDASENRKRKVYKKIMRKFRAGSLPHRIVRKVYEAKRELLFTKQTLKNCRRDAEKITEAAINAFSNVKQPFFMFLFYPDLHYPYNPPREYIEEMKKCPLRGEDDIETSEILQKLLIPLYRNHIRWNLMNDTYASQVINRYDATVRYVDTQIGRLLKTVEELGFSDDTIIILLSDHGESFIEHEIFFEHHGLYDVSIQIPLILRYSELSKNKKIEGLVQNIDVFPTIMDLLDLNIEGDGKSLLPLIEEGKEIRPAVYAMENGWRYGCCLRTKQWKYIYHHSEQGAYCNFCGRVHGELEELYDLEIDPGETQNVISDNSEIADGLKKQVSKKFISIL